MTDRYAVIGNPIAHSRSPAIHARFAAQTGQDIAYERLLAPLEGFAATVAVFRAAGGRGCADRAGGSRPGARRLGVGATIPGRPQ